jgi:hypothetical protein
MILRDKMKQLNQALRVSRESSSHFEGMSEYWLTLDTKYDQDCGSYCHLKQTPIISTESKETTERVFKFNESEHLPGANKFIIGGGILSGGAVVASQVEIPSN